VIVGLWAPPVVVRVRCAIRFYNHWLGNNGSDNRIACTAKNKNGKRGDSDDQTANQKSQERTDPGTCCLSHSAHLFAIKPHLRTVPERYGSQTGPCWKPDVKRDGE
jgi:hypothetical protein